LRILFDKNVPYPLLHYLAKHDMRTAEELGWARLVNGDLLRAAEDAGFGILVTADQSLEYQQNLKGRKLALIVLSTNHIGALEKHPEKLVAAVNAAREGSYEFVRFNLPPRRELGD
jgi:hypothetical protein